MLIRGNWACHWPDANAWPFRTPNLRGVKWWLSSVLWIYSHHGLVVLQLIRRFHVPALCQVDLSSNNGPNYKRRRQWQGWPYCLFIWPRYWRVRLFFLRCAIDRYFRFRSTFMWLISVWKVFVRNYQRIGSDYMTTIKRIDVTLLLFWVRNRSVCGVSHFQSNPEVWMRPLVPGPGVENRKPH